MRQLFGRSYFFCKQVVNTPPLNSINPIHQFVAYGYYFPKEWTKEFIQQQIDPNKKQIEQLQIIKNKLGIPSGKILFRFKNQQAMKKIIEKYNEDFILTKDSTYRVVIKPFKLKTQIQKVKRDSIKTKYVVKVKNLDFDIKEEELKRIAKDYGTVNYIQMNLRPNGLNDGAAKIYFSHKKEAQEFYYFVDGLKYKQRKLTAEIINTLKNQQNLEQKLLKIPVITIKANQKVYKMMISQKADKIGLNQQ